MWRYAAPPKASSQDSNQTSCFYSWLLFGPGLWNDPARLNDTLTERRRDGRRYLQGGVSSAAAGC